LYRHIVVFRIRHFVPVIMMVRPLEVGGPARHLQHANVLDLWRPALIVLHNTGMDTAAAADAATKVQRIHELHTIHRPDITEIRLYVIASANFLADAPQHFLHLGGRQFLVVLLKELLECILLAVKILER
jgi:hypothetical protein